MPEGPEIWILSEAINKFYHTEKTKSYGKHLFVFKNEKECENWSFGLTGKVSLLDNNEVVKINTGWIFGDQVAFDDYEVEIKKFGINWLTSSEADLRKEVDNWIKSKKKLAGLMLDQTKISGIGVAWGSEILFKAGLRPDMRCCDQVLTEGRGVNKLANSMIEIRENIKKMYSEQLDESDSKEFINEWFENLYENRDMNIYKKGSQLKVLGRSWWV
jgi:formamidopyrimidine-DNA glycosylase